MRAYIKVGIMLFMKLDGVGHLLHFFCVPHERSGFYRNQAPLRRTTTSAFAEHNSLALRIGFSHYIKHLRPGSHWLANGINERLSMDLSMFMENCTLGLSRDGQVSKRYHWSL